MTDTPGTVYITPGGSVYRLIGYDRDRLTGENLPRFNVMLADGMFTTSRTLPGGSVTIWEPVSLSPNVKHSIKDGGSDDA